MSHDFPIPRQDNHQDGPPDGVRDSRQPDGRGEPDADAGTPSDGRSDGLAIVEWGEPAATGRRRAWQALAGVGRDGRVVPVIAGLGAVATFASLVGEWTIIRIPGDVDATDAIPIQLVNGVADVATFGTGYLIGVLGLISCLALVFFGAPAVRHNARVIGLAGSAGVLGVLVAATLWLDTLTDRGLMYSQIDGLRIEYGRGLLMAYVGIGGLGLAFLLAGRFITRPTGGAGPPAGSADPEAPGDGAGDSDWPWRRPRPATEPERDDDGLAPIDLTVTPAAPFVRSEQQHPR